MWEAAAAAEAENVCSSVTAEFANEQCIRWPYIQSVCAVWVPGAIWPFPNKSCLLTQQS